MDSCVGNLLLSWCINHLDDVIIFANTPKGASTEIERNIYFTEAGLKLKPSKCEFFRTSLSYLGHGVSKNGMEMDKKKIEAIVNWPTSVTVTNAEAALNVLTTIDSFFPSMLI